MVSKEIGLHNLKIHYIWTFFSSILFLSPIITLYYKLYGLEINDILILTSINSLFRTILEIPTSTIGDTIGRVKVMKMSVLSSLISFLILFIFPNIYGFYFAIFFSALGNALWSGTGHAKLQEDLEISGKTEDFGKVIGILIALQNIGKLFTPIIIYFVLKYFDSGYRILAGLDIFTFIIAIIFVFKFIEFGEIQKTENKKEFLKLQLDTLKKGTDFILKSKTILILLLISILGNDLGYLGKILLPSLTKNGIEDFLSSYIVWFSIFSGIIGNLIPRKFGNIFREKNIFYGLILGNSILHIFASFLSNNNILLICIFILNSFIMGIYHPFRNHIFMKKLTDTKEKATIRSLFLTILGLFEFIILFTFSFLKIEICFLILGIFIFLGLLVSIKNERLKFI